MTRRSPGSESSTDDTTPGGVASPAVARLVAAVTVETLGRVALAGVHPALAVLAPPVVGVSLLAPGAHDARRLGRAVAASGAGHPVAVAGGVVAFLLLDTPVRAAAYAVGVELSPPVVLLVPFVEVAVGTLAAWAVLAPLVARVTTAEPLREAVGDGLRVVVSAPRRTVLRWLRGVGIGATAVVAGVAGLVVGVGVGPTVSLAAGTVAAVSAGVTATVVAVPTLVRTNGPTTTPTDDPSGVESGSSRSMGVRSGDPSVARLAVVAVLIVGLTATAGAVRVTETRPTPTAGPLPADASEAYATAVANTQASDHRFTYRSVDPPGAATGQFAVTRTLDRSDRQYRVTTTGAIPARPAYADSGTGYPTTGTFRPFAFGERPVTTETGQRTVTALPAYWTYDALYRLDGGELTLPASGTGEWERNEAEPTQLVLTEPRAVFAALFGPPPAPVTADRARIAVSVDPDRGVITGGEAAFDGTVGDRSIVFVAGYEVESGPHVDADRPEEVGPRSPGEWLWKLLAY